MLFKNQEYSFVLCKHRKLKLWPKATTTKKEYRPSALTIDYTHTHTTYIYIYYISTHTVLKYASQFKHRLYVHTTGMYAFYLFLKINVQINTATD